MARNLVVAVAAALTLLAGCSAVSEPNDFTTVKNTASYQAIRTNMQDIYDESVEVTRTAIGAGELRGRGTIGETICGEAFGDEFQELEARGSLSGRADSQSQAMDLVRAAWEAKGWDVETVDPDRLIRSAKTAEGVTYVVRATVESARNDASKIAVGLALSTSCLKLPD